MRMAVILHNIHLNAANSSLLHLLHYAKIDIG